MTAHKSVVSSHAQTALRKARLSRHCSDRRHSHIRASVHAVRRLSDAKLRQLPGGQLIAPLLGPDCDGTLPFAVAVELSPHQPHLPQQTQFGTDTPSSTYALQYILEGRGEVCFGSLAQHSQRVQAGDTVLSPSDAGQYIPEPGADGTHGRPDGPGHLARLVVVLPKELFDDGHAADIEAYMQSYASIEAVWGHWQQQPEAGVITQQEVHTLLSRRQKPLPAGTSPLPPHLVSCSTPMAYTVFPYPPPAAHPPPPAPILAHHQPSRSRRTHVGAPSHEQASTHQGAAATVERQMLQRQVSIPTGEVAMNTATPTTKRLGPIGPAEYLAALVDMHDRVVASSHALLRHALSAVGEGHGSRERGQQLVLQGGAIDWQAWQQSSSPTAHMPTIPSSRQYYRDPETTTTHAARSAGRRQYTEDAAAPLVMKRAIDDLDTFQLPNQSNMLAIIFDPLQHAVPFTFGIEVFQPGHKTPPHVHTHAHELFFVLAGEGEGFCDGERFPVSPGDLLLFPPGSLHGLDVSDRGKMFCLEFMLPNQQFVEMVRSGEVARLGADELCHLNVIAC